MKTRRTWSYGWAVAAIVAGPLAAQDPMLPQPVLPVRNMDYAPTALMPPIPAPAPVTFPQAESAIEQVGHHPARLRRPIPMSSQVVAPTSTNWPVLTSTSSTVAVPINNSSAAPTSPTMAAPMWRWYGWGTANPAGAQKAIPNMDGLNAVPTPTSTNEPPIAPATKPTGIFNAAPAPAWNSPPKSPEPPVPDNSDPPAPTLTPPSLDMQTQPPKPTFRGRGPSANDPWIGVGPTTKVGEQRRAKDRSYGQSSGMGPTFKVAEPSMEIVASSAWIVARASSHP